MKFTLITSFAALAAGAFAAPYNVTAAAEDVAKATEPLTSPLIPFPPNGTFPFPGCHPSHHPDCHRPHISPIPIPHDAAPSLGRSAGAIAVGVAAVVALSM
ncbi:hypothetical protein F5Y03DRAFT_396247 [Xylaria venustula]|nr:hypothetical protein F5Y03DRAFT_396247 [Xylaria venustula]